MKKTLRPTLRETAVVVYDPIPAHEHVGNRGFTRWHVSVRPGGEVSDALRDPHHAVVDYLARGFQRILGLENGWGRRGGLHFGSTTWLTSKMHTDNVGTPYSSTVEYVYS